MRRKIGRRAVTRGVLTAWAAGAMGGVVGGGIAGCARRGAGGGRVVLYTSADDYVVRAVVDAFTAERGIAVDVVGDTEATKTFGLVRRISDERAQPRADVWWSSEPMGSIQLAREGVLAPLVLDAATRVTDTGAGWPESLRDAEGRWYGMGMRARVMAYHTGRVKEPEAPRRLRDLEAPLWKGRVGIAKAQFGTTRAHVAALLAEHGEAKTRAWLEALRDNGAKVYPSNSAVVRGISEGEISVGLTDTDDVWAGQANGWPVAAAYEVFEDAPTARAMAGLGALMLPNTVGLVKGGPNPAAAQQLALFLLGAKGERTLAESDSRNIPVRPSVRQELGAAFARYEVPTPWQPDLVKVEAQSAAAVQLFDEVFGVK